jgi:hypothetical protein
MLSSSHIINENSESIQTFRQNGKNAKSSIKQNLNSKNNLMTTNTNKILDSISKTKERLNTDGLASSIDINVKVNNMKEEGTDEINNSISRKSISTKNIMKQSSNVLDKKNLITDKKARDKTPFIKDKDKEKVEKMYNKIANSMKTPDKLVNKNSDINQEENISKNINNSSISHNNRKSIQVKKSSNLRGSGTMSDGKSLIRNKTEKFITSNFNSGNNETNNISGSYYDKEKNKKSVTKKKSDLNMSNKIVPGILKNKEFNSEKVSNNSIIQPNIDNGKQSYKSEEPIVNKINQDKITEKKQIPLELIPKPKPKILFFKKLKHAVIPEIIK